MRMIKCVFFPSIVLSNIHDTYSYIHDLHIVLNMRDIEFVKNVISENERILITIQWKKQSVSIKLQHSKERMSN